MGSELDRKAGLAADAALSAKAAAEELEAEFARFNRDGTAVEDLVAIFIAAGVVWPEKLPSTADFFFYRRLVGEKEKVEAAAAAVTKNWRSCWPGSMTGLLTSCLGEEALKQMLQGSGLVFGTIGANSSDGWIVGTPEVVAEVRKQWKKKFLSLKWW